MSFVMENRMYMGFTSVSWKEAVRLELSTTRPSIERHGTQGRFSRGMNAHNRRAMYEVVC